MSTVVDERERPGQVTAHVAERVVPHDRQVSQRVAGLRPQSGDLLAQSPDVLREGLLGVSPVRIAVRHMLPNMAEPLSEREQEVLRLLAVGRSNQALARELVVSIATVKTHLIHIYRKLGAHTRTEAIARARALGLV